MPQTVTPAKARLRITATLNRPAAYSELKAHVKGKPAKDAKRIDTPEAMQVALGLLDGAVSRARKNTPALVITDLMVCRFGYCSFYSCPNLCDHSLIILTTPLFRSQNTSDPPMYRLQTLSFKLVWTAVKLT